MGGSASGLEGDEAWANAAFVTGAEAMLQRALAQARAFRAERADGEKDLAYGPLPRQRLDLYRPEGQAKGLMLFVHGGYWLAFGHQDWAHLAAGALARGWAVALPSYTLAPEGRIAAMGQEVAAAVRFAAARVPGLVVVTGHSAGGHLAARMGCADMAVPVARVVPISGLAELAPMATTAMQATLRLDADEIAAESPARLALRQGCAAHVWVGGQERPGFLWQARALAEAWGCPWTVEPGRHHFDVIDGLSDPKSALVEACLGWV